MKGKMLRMQLQTVPARLAVNRLQNGWKEFFCYLIFDKESASTIEHICWHLAIAPGEKALLDGRLTLAAQERAAGRVAIAALLPPVWEAGVLLIDFRSTAGARTFERAIPAYRQKGTFLLPFAGQVLIVGGHRVGEVHRAARQIPSQQLGWDMLPLGEDGLRLLNVRNSKHLRPDDFAGFGQAVLAPAAGKVVQAIDGLADLSQVGQLPEDTGYYLEDLTRASGNHVILDHGGGVWSCLAHLRNGSLSVQAGQTIGAGQVLGEMGNSGFSSGPHLHIHFMDGPDLLTASPLPVEFEIEGERHAPQSGEIVSGAMEPQS